MTKKTAVDVLREAAELKELKSKDYQGGKWTEADYFPFDDLSYKPYGKYCCYHS